MSGVVIFYQAIYQLATWEFYQDLVIELYEGAQELATLFFRSPNANEVLFVWLNLIAWPICFQKLIDHGLDPDP